MHLTEDYPGKYGPIIKKRMNIGEMISITCSCDVITNPL